MSARLEFESSARRVDAGELVDAVDALRRGRSDGRTRVAATMAWAGFSCPGAIGAVYGNNRSAMFLASVTTITHVMQPAGFPVLMQLIAEARQHGRRAPALMDIEREEEWNDSIETIRARHGIPVYRSALSANLLETLAGG